MSHKSTIDELGYILETLADAEARLYEVEDTGKDVQVMAAYIKLQALIVYLQSLRNEFIDMDKKK